MSRGPWLGQVAIATLPAPRPPRLCLAGPRLGAIAALNDGSFSRALAAPFAVIDFWSPGCPYCVTYKPVFEEVAALVGDRVFMATAQIEDTPKASQNFTIGPIPSTVFLAQGKEVGRIEGAISKDELLAEISRRTGVSVADAAGTPWGWIAGGLAAAGLLVYAATR